ncbi:hypothetical protein CXG81DRAFT_16560 [Caulochytrium protostelioides]|uniref:Oxidoreductase FAD/NAD(P)-binding domain-containing protein n=1 Tax=Caulochytrium protostelioides TaxID=1555241 RepID=A0A4P9XFI8_9FUNG|nr:hypothetical protein CXG81DRAFT_16560 [Caulochytrium protostelioides]|eukprot:RKP03991.1 hypothetical protein CXG81DRAFT_16560 [Caulochytrium protostelioides]
MQRSAARLGTAIHRHAGHLTLTQAVQRQPQRLVAELVSAHQETHHVKQFDFIVRDVLPDPDRSPLWLDRPPRGPRGRTSAPLAAPPASPAVAGVASSTADGDEGHGVERLTPFQPGQWCDFFVRGIETVAGFSLVSAPHALPRFQLALQESAYSAIVQHLWHRARPHERFQLRFGGGFVLQSDRRTPLLLIAGGVGLNPLMSMLRTLAARGHDAPVQLLYSVADAADVLFLDALDTCLRQLPSAHATLFLTQDLPADPGSRAAAAAAEWPAALTPAARLARWRAIPRTRVETGRIGPEHLAARLAALQARPRAPDGATPVHGVHVYMCGPTSMENALIRDLQHMQIDPDAIFYEEWW